MTSFAGLEFIFRFLPVFLIVYYLVPVKYKDIVLLLGSLLFYTMGSPFFVLLLLLLTVVNYALAKKNAGEERKKRKRFLKKPGRKRRMAAVICLDVLVLILFKVLGSFEDMSLFPLGISFYLFKMISYQVDIYKGDIWEKQSFVKTALYFSLFPQVLSGPIMRYKESASPAERIYSLEQFEEGLYYFVLGLGMKVLLADQLASLWKELQIIGYHSISTPLAWLGAFGYSLQLYFDFWGYSLMSSGLMLMLGFGFIRNFDHPYAARSISEFYRKWHISLGSFFRDYVYIPAGGSRCGRGRTIRNLLLVWLLTGFWHGNTWNYFLWGGVLGCLVIMEKFVYGSALQKIPFLGHLYVLCLIPLTWVLFAIPDSRQLCIYFERLFGVHGTGIAVNIHDIENYLQSYGLLIAAGILLCIPAVFRFIGKHRKNPVMVLLLTGMFWLCIYFITNRQGNPFMYLKF